MHEKKKSSVYTFQGNKEIKKINEDLVHFPSVCMVTKQSGGLLSLTRETYYKGSVSALCDIPMG